MPITALTNRSVIRLCGPDCDLFLQGIITQDIGLLNHQSLIFSAMLSAQGKFLFDFFIHADGNDRLIEIDAAHADAFIKTLTMYKLRSNVAITLQPDLYIYAAWGADRPDGFVPDPRLPQLGSRAILAQQQTTASPQEYNAHRLLLGVPDGACDASERYFLLELGYDVLGGVSFTKGCYVGQEPTARMHYRHILRKCLWQITGDPLPSPGEELWHEDKPIGQMRSSCKTIGLAMLRLEGLSATVSLTASSLVLTATLPPYMQARIAALKQEQNQAP